MRRKKNRHRGSAFDDYLHEEGIHAEVTAHALKSVLATELRRTMERDGISKTAMAKRLATSRSELDRLLDPDDARDVRLNTLAKVADALGKRMVFALEDA